MYDNYNKTDSSFQFYERVNVPISIEIYLKYKCIYFVIAYNLY